MTHQTNTNDPIDFPQMTTQELLSGIWSMPPGTHQPDNWIFMCCQDDEHDYYRVLSCWYSDWRVSSQVVGVQQFSDHWLVTTTTGSEYVLVADRNQPSQSAVNFANRLVKHWREASPQEFVNK